MSQRTLRAFFSGAVSRSAAVKRPHRHARVASTKTKLESLLTEREVFRFTDSSVLHHYHWFIALNN